MARVVAVTAAATGAAAMVAAREEVEMVVAMAEVAMAWESSPKQNLLYGFTPNRRQGHNINPSPPTCIPSHPRLPYGLSQHAA